MTDLPGLITLFLEDRTVRGCSPRTVERYMRELTTWSTWSERHLKSTSIDVLNPVAVRSYLAYLQKDHRIYRGGKRGQIGVSPWSLRGAAIIILTFARFLGQEEILPTDAVQSLTKRIHVPRIERAPRPIYTIHQITRLLKACETWQEELSWRNRLMILLTLDTGMRVSELCNMQDERIDLEQKHAQIQGKRNQWRLVFWGEGTAVAIDRYLAVRRGDWGGPLLRGCNSRNQGGQMKPDGIRDALETIANRAKVPLPKGSPMHSMRHTFARSALEKVDVRIVQQFLGHRDIRTTMIYTEMNPDELREFHTRISGWWVE